MVKNESHRLPAYSYKYGGRGEGAPSACCQRNRGWYMSKLFWVVCGTWIMVVLGLFVPSLKPLTFSYGVYLGMVWWAILLGIFLGGVIDRFVPEEYIVRLLKQGEKKTIFISVLLGFLASACSHGILALAIELHKKGASSPAVISFLLASPWANLPVTILLIGFFGLKGVLIIFAALLVAISTGLVFLVLERKGWIETRHNNPQNDFSIAKDIREGFQNYKWTWNQFKRDLQGVLQGMAELSKKILWWFLIGLFLASLASAYVPSSFFQRFMGHGPLGPLITLLAAAVIEICSEGTAPLSFEIFKQTGALGSSFVFLIGGVVVDYTELGLIWINMGKRTALWLVLVSVPQVLLLGYLFNLFLS